MTDLSRSNPTGRFSGLEDLYARFRPSYPSAAIDLILQRCGLGGPNDLLADIGCGTGISSRLFAAHGVPVLGIEPNEEMRRRAEREPIPSGGTAPIYRSGRAEATGLTDGSVAAVLAAQAFHWFDGPAALLEFHRILRPAGWVALVWNERDETDPGTEAYGTVIRTAPDTAAIEGPRGRAGKILLDSPLFEDAERLRFHNEQDLDEEGILGRAFSASYAPREPAAANAFAQALRDVFARFQRDGTMILRYETTVYLARRRNVLASEAVHVSDR
jgi:SAM-dependent methyltransferase